MKIYDIALDDSRDHCHCQLIANIAIVFVIIILIVLGAFF